MTRTRTVVSRPASPVWSAAFFGVSSLDSRFWVFSDEAFTTEWKGTSRGFLDHRLFQNGRNFPLCMFLIAVEGALFYLVNNIWVRLNRYTDREAFLSSGYAGCRGERDLGLSRRPRYERAHQRFLHDGSPGVPAHGIL